MDCFARKRKQKEIDNVLVVLAIVFGLLFFTCAGIMAYKAIKFDRGCAGYLKRAADASTIELAKEQLLTSVMYAEEHNLTSGYTSVLYRTPNEDIGYWYRNIKTSYAELEYVTMLERTMNALYEDEITLKLIKLREVLLDNDCGSESATFPSGISIYPHNKLYAIWVWLSLILFICPIIYFLMR